MACVSGPWMALIIMRGRRFREYKVAPDFRLGERRFRVYEEAPSRISPWAPYHVRSPAMGCDDSETEESPGSPGYPEDEDDPACRWCDMRGRAAAVTGASRDSTSISNKEVRSCLMAGSSYDASSRCKLNLCIYRLRPRRRMHGSSEGEGGCGWVYQYAIYGQTSIMFS